MMNAKSESCEFYSWTRYKTIQEIFYNLLIKICNIIKLSFQLSRYMQLRYILYKVIFDTEYLSYQNRSYCVVL